MRHRFVRAYWPWTCILRAMGMLGLTMPWGSIYVLPEAWGRSDLRRHELIHIRQMERDGRVRFCIRYLWELMTKGYRNISYEIEAYEMGFGGRRKTPNTTGVREDESTGPRTGFDRGIRPGPAARDDEGTDPEGSLIEAQAGTERRRKLAGGKSSLIG